MAQLVMGAVGAVVGFYVGGPTGAAYGWSIGVALGGALDPQNSKTQGPRINDLKVQASSYGAAIPIVYGAMRVNGNVIFCTDKREVATETNTDAGKGGPTVTNTTYSYNVDIAIALCAGPIVGIRKVWSSGKLIYDNSVDASLATVMASAVKCAGMTVYTGTETQLPDPTIEATIGAGNVPAYRGTAYVVFSQLDCPNGQIPQLSFEVAAAGTLPSPPLNDITVRWSDKWTPGTPHWVDVSTLHAAVVSYGDSGPSPGDTPSYVTLLDNVHTRFGLSAANMGSQFVSRGDPTNSSGPYISVAAQDFSSGDFTIETFVYLDPANQIAGGWLFNCRGMGYAFSSPWDPESLYARGALSCWITPAGLVRFFVGKAGSGAGPTQEFNANIPVGTLSHLTIQRIGGQILIGVDGVNRSTTQQQAAIVQPGGGPDFRIGGIWNQSQPVPGNGAFVGTILEFRISMGVGRYGWGSYLVPSVPFGMETRVAPIQPTVASIIADICARAGLAAPQIDVSTLTDVVDGFAITNVSPARSNLDPLLKCFQIDAVESDGVLRFIKRAAQTSAASVPWTDLGASASADDMPGDPAPLQRMQEVDLPRSVTVNFMNVDADYQSGTEASRRAVTASANDVVQELPVATNAAQAAAVAEALLYTAWNERNARTVKLPRSWAQLDPCDVITLEYPQGAFSAKRIVKATDDGATVELALVDADPSIYASTPPGATPGGAQAGVSQPPPTNLALLDIPILRDADDNPGLYAAMAGYGPGWPGAVLYGGADDAQLAPRGSVANGAAIGYAVTALGNWQFNTVDETNTVTVALASGALYNTTRDNMLDQGANALLLGGEIIAFATATPLGGGQYVLSSLLRGQRGTEAARGTHAVGERAVLLAMAGMLRPNMDLGALNTAQSWRGISVGLPVASQQSTRFANTGQGLKPFSPVNLRRSTAANDITLTWDRRTRSSVTFPPGNGADVPLFEGSEKYQVDVYANNTFATIVRSILSGLPQVTYTAAQQTADGLTPGAAVNVRIYQVSASVGLGAPLQGTI